MNDLTGPPRRAMVLHRLVVSDGSIEALKWVALVLMTLDHLNKYVFHDAVPALFALGRLTLPLFAFVLAYNLARPGTLTRGTYRRTAARLMLYGALASIPFVALGGLGAGWWPFNVMATLLVATGVIYLLERRGVFRTALAMLLFLLGGGLVEFWWPGIALTVAAWFYVQRPSWPALLAWILATMALNLNGWAFARMPVVNASVWAMAAFPIIFTAPYLELRLPRFPRAFYAYYPLHLGVLWVLNRLIQSNL